MYKKLLSLAVMVTLFAGCASVPTEAPEVAEQAKTFADPAAGNAGLYIYRTGGPGGALKKDVWVNGECIGQTAPKVFFYQEVPGGKEYKLSTESEFSPNDLMVKTEAGQNYFIEQYIKVGVFVGGAGLKLVSAEEGKADIAKLKMAKKGTCSQ